jgi:thioredoxin-related protein
MESAMRPRWRRALVAARRLRIGGYYTVGMKAWLFALLLAGSAHAQELPAWFSQSLLILPEDIADAAKEKKRVMLYFEQEGCPYCKRMVEVNFRDPRIAGRLQDRFVPIALNIWGDREVTAPDGKVMSEKQLAAALRVQFTPTLIFLDEKGSVSLRVNGYYPPERFLAALDAAAGPGPVAENATATAMARRPRTKPLALLFVADGCRACDELKVTLRDDNVAKQLARFDLEQLPMAGAQAKQMAVGEAPTLVLFDAKGQEVLRLEAYFRAFHVAGSLEYVASGAYRTEPSFQRFLQTKADRMRRGGQPVDLWN